MAVNFALEEVSQRLSSGDTGAEELLGAAQRRLYAGIDELRGLMRRLHPPMLDTMGLPSALAELLASFEERTRIRCVLDGDHNAMLTQELRTVLYRVVQEALVNVKKHSHAHRVWVSLHTSDSHAHLRVRDDGIGFDLPSVNGLAGRGRFGLAGIRARVQQVGGTIKLSSQAGSGTTIAVSVPLTFS